MKDNLEKFIHSNRDEFDSYTPPQNIWQAIEQKINRKPYRMGRVYTSAAAAIVLLIAASLWFIKHDQSKSIPHANTEAVVIPEIKDAEVYYTSIVESKRSQANQMCSAHPGICKDFEAEIDTLQVLYGQLKVEYQNSNGNEAVLRAMIQNLQLQVQLLNRQSQVIQEVKQNEKIIGNNSKLM